jgi:hypothetical protein
MKLKRLELDEKANLQQAQQRKEMGECQCCFSDFPLNRMVFCDGNDNHPFCFDCLKRYVETEIGQSHCRPVCFATVDCQELFSRQQLRQALDEKTFDRLEHMQPKQQMPQDQLSALPKRNAHPAQLQGSQEERKALFTACHRRGHVSGLDPLVQPLQASLCQGLWLQQDDLLALWERAMVRTNI